MVRQWTVEQRKTKAEEQRAYWATHNHPRLHAAHDEQAKQKMVRSRQNFPQRGVCRVCSRPLYQEQYIRAGVGPICARKIGLSLPMHAAENEARREKSK